MRFCSACIVTALFLSLCVSAEAQAGGAPSANSDAPAAKAEIKTVPPGYTNPSSGRQMFDAYCASCHGQGGKGNGPAASALKATPTDLTQLAAKNGGKFPEAHVAQVIRGDSLTPAHGSKDMPVWGPIFFSLAQHDSAQEQLRIRNLTRYVASMQQK